VSTNRTTILIAHKLSTVRKAHNIAVISNGRVIEQGNHNKLIELGGMYSRMVKAQDLGEDNGCQEQEEEKAVDEHAALSLLQSYPLASRAAEVHAWEEYSSKPNYGLLKCLRILLGEQKELRLELLITFVACIMGGRHRPSTS
jgi:ATP-binding cassette, subfamily B (MDR/TAP), member 1